MYNSFSIKVPGSSANLGPGFDSVGIALGLYLTLEVELSDRWRITTTSPELQQLSKAESHFIFNVAKIVSRKYGIKIPPCSIKMNTSIPLARGLGSSAAAIVAGIELADQLGHLQLTQQEKLQIATEIEGHPDNVGASLYGGLVIGSYFKNEVHLLSFSELDFEVVGCIPNSTLLTSESRKVLPSGLGYKEAVAASSVANLLIASLLSQNWIIAGKMMENDLFHQPYRKDLIPFYDQFEKVAKKNGAFGVALSGAGPTLLAFIEKGQAIRLKQSLTESFPQSNIQLLPIDRKGSQVYKKNAIL
ncbi:homoserine kinase [Bacillus sp. CGMCC 1.16607]|uniref:homoserine kinase n=1 Tax=Bacillus sp. CGMCC 1.16607 TaxID=3351842 RepID=UPI003633DEE7